MTSLRDHYAAMQASADPKARRVAQAQLERLERRRHVYVVATSEDYPPSPWRHVPLALLLEAAGNATHERSNGTFVSGHEPVHSSKSGLCLVVWSGEGRFWCASCGRGGDAVSLLMSVQGWSYRAAARYLAVRFGPPPSARRPGLPASRTDVFRHG
jgi:hypothetical protein